MSLKDAGFTGSFWGGRGKGRKNSELENQRTSGRMVHGLNSPCAVALYCDVSETSPNQISVSPVFHKWSLSCLLLPLGDSMITQRSSSYTTNQQLLNFGSI